jgi:hypothetical protein
MIFLHSQECFLNYHPPLIIAAILLNLAECYFINFATIYFQADTPAGNKNRWMLNTKIMRR